MPAAVVGSSTDKKCFGRVEEVSVSRLTVGVMIMLRLSPRLQLFQDDSTAQLAVSLSYVIGVLVVGLLMVMIMLALSIKLFTRTHFTAPLIPLVVNITASTLGWLGHAVFVCLVTALATSASPPPSVALLLLLVEVLPAGIALVSGAELKRSVSWSASLSRTTKILSRNTAASTHRDRDSPASRSVVSDHPTFSPPTNDGVDDEY